MTDSEVCVAIIGTHLLMYTPEAEASRSVLAEVFGFESVDAGDGWLVFRLPPAELGVHPSEGSAGHSISLMCDDIRSTVAELSAKGLAFQGPPVETGWGVATTAVLPGGLEVMIYEPRHRLAIDG